MENLSPVSDPLDLPRFSDIGAGIPVSAEPPSNPQNNDLWFDLDDEGDGELGGGNSNSYNETIPGTGTGAVNVVHNLASTDISVTVQRISVPAGTSHPLGVVYLHWVPVDANTVSVDFDTYNRAAGEFRVKVST